MFKGFNNRLPNLPSLEIHLIDFSVDLIILTLQQKLYMHALFNSYIYK